jgi:oligopeptidase B
LRDREDPDTRAYLEAENAYADAFFAPLQDTVDAIYGEILGRTKLTDTSPPVRWGPYAYETRTREGLNYPIHVRTPLDGGPEQVLLDENTEAEGHEFHEVGAFDVSPSHGKLIWSVDHDGGEEYELRIRDLATGLDLADRIAPTYYGTAWSLDERHVFYTVPDEQMRPYQVWRHAVGDPDGTTDVLVFQEDDDRFNIDLGNTRSGEWILISLSSHTTSETWVIPAADPTAAPRVLEPRQAGHEYDVDHWGDRWIVATNLADDGSEAEDFRVVTAPVAAGDRASWTELIPHRPGCRVHGVEAFASFAVVREWSDAVPVLRIVQPDGSSRPLVFDEPVHSVGLAGNPEYRTETLRYGYQSLTTPDTVIDEHVPSGERTVVKVTEVVGGHDPSQYETRREWAVSHDGTKVPIDIVFAKGTPLDGTAPTMLYAYGSYEASMSVWFSVARLSLLQRGVVYAWRIPGVAVSWDAAGTWTASWRTSATRSWT